MILKLITTSLKMKLRDKTSFFYALIFPIIFLTVFGLFDMDNMGQVNLVIVEKEKTQLTEGLVKALKEIDNFKITETKNKDEFMEELKGDKKDAILEISDASGPLPKIEATATYKKENEQAAGITKNAIEMIAAKTSMEMAKAPEILNINENILNDKKFKYFDFIFPGILGMGLMMYAIMNGAVRMTKDKEQHILKRLFVTPLSGRDFFLAETVSAMTIAVIQVLIVIGYSLLVFKVNIYGSIPLIFALAIFGNLIFVNIGFLISAISKSTSSAEGLANIISLPMMFLSGTFFQRELLPKIVQDISAYLPLTPLLDALRSVIISGEGIGDIQKELILLSIWFVGTYLLLAKFFKFSEE